MTTPNSNYLTREQLMKSNEALKNTLSKQENELIKLELKIAELQKDRELLESKGFMAETAAWKAEKQCDYLKEQIKFFQSLLIKENDIKPSIIQGVTEQQ